MSIISINKEVPMTGKLADFRAPTAIEKLFNRVFGFLVGIGVGASHHYLLEVRGRKSGKLYSNPVDLLEMNGRKFLVAPRGRTQWVRNAEANGEVTLKKGGSRRQFHLRPLAGEEKLAVLKGYLDAFKSEVQRYFPIQAGSPPEAFRDVEDSYPAFELLVLEILAS
jgi:deazaflavin-dependent oxidoreductase (nitroreductase family)